MARRKDPIIPDTLLDQLLAGGDAKSAFDQNGLLDQLKKALAERVLKAEMDHHLVGDEVITALWRHELRQVSRIRGYAGAREVIVDVLEYIEDDEELAVVLDMSGSPLSAKRKQVSRQHWLNRHGRIGQRFK